MRPEVDHRSAVDSIRRYYSPLIQHAEVGSREYAQLALKSVISLNAGVAVAYPAIVEIFLENITVNEFIWPVAIAVLGAVSGVICAYVVYFNHGYEAQESFTKMELEVVKADEFFDTETYFRFQSHRAQTKEHWTAWNERYGKRRDWTFYIGNVFGVLGLSCFAISVIWFAISVGS